MELDELTEGIWVVRDTHTGWWWRPKASGYTQELAAAGICDEKTAENWAKRKSPNRHGDYQDEAIPLSEALKGLGDGTVLRAMVLRLQGAFCHQTYVLDKTRQERDTAETERDRLRDELKHAKAAALELRDAWVPKEKHTEFPWEE